MEKTNRKGGFRKGSGRKGFFDEAMVKKIIDASNQIIFDTLTKVGEYKDVEKEVRVELASRFSLKAVPNKIESDGSFAPKTVILVRNDRAVREEASLRARQIHTEQV